MVKCFDEFNSPNSDDTVEFLIHKFHDIYEGLIGNDILMKYMEIIDYKNRVLRINGRNIKLYFSNEPENTFYYIDPGEHFYRIPVDIETGNILINETKINNKVTILEGLYDVEDFKARAKIINIDREPQILNFNENFKTSELKEISDLNTFEHFKDNTSSKNNLANGDKIPKDIRMNHLNQEERNELARVLMNYREIFDNTKLLTFTNEIKHKIKLTDSVPVKNKTYRYPYIHKEEVQNQIEDLLRNNIIRHSSSPYNSPVWIVQKKADASGIPKWRLVIDYRKLNEKTIDDSYPIPNIGEILDKLGKCNYFSTIDLKSGFHQIEMTGRMWKKRLSRWTMAITNI